MKAVGFGRGHLQFLHWLKTMSWKEVKVVFLCVCVWTQRKSHQINLCFKNVLSLRFVMESGFDRRLRSFLSHSARAHSHRKHRLCFDPQRSTPLSGCLKWRPTLWYPVIGSENPWDYTGTKTDQIRHTEQEMCKENGQSGRMDTVRRFYLILRHFLLKCQHLSHSFT